MDRKDIVLLVVSSVVVIPGRLILIKSTIGQETASSASIYLSAQPNKRKEEIKLIHASAEITPRTIM